MTTIDVPMAHQDFLPVSRAAVLVDYDTIGYSADGYTTVSSKIKAVMESSSTIDGMDSVPVIR